MGVTRRKTGNDLAGTFRMKAASNAAGSKRKQRFSRWIVSANLIFYMGRLRESRVNS
jgi:hypothetical protein